MVKKITVFCICKKCGKEFHPIDSVRRLYCSRDCRVADRKMNNCICENCGKKFISNSYSISKYCGKDCLNTKYKKIPTGKNHKEWIYGCGEYFRKIARKITGSNKIGLITHHIDGNYRNNLPENLMVMTRSEHTKLHWLQGDIRGGQFEPVA